MGNGTSMAVLPECHDSGHVDQDTNDIDGIWKEFGENLFPNTLNAM